MTELKKPSAEHQRLAAEWLRQYASGEIYAQYWQWSYVDEKNGLEGKICLSNAPVWYEGCTLSYEPARKHPHYALFKEWEAHKASGAVDSGEYMLGNPAKAFLEQAVEPFWRVDFLYEIVKTDKHPDNQKPKLKLLDWEHMPIGTMTNFGVLLGFNTITHGLVLLNRNVIERADKHIARISPATQWTAIQDNELAPTCEGLVIEYRGLGGDDCTGSATNLSMIACVNAYRVIGIRDGWTDDPAKAGV
jgi:hypothetical protein